MAKSKLKNSNIILASTPIFVALAVLWNEASGGLHTSWIVGGALILGVIGIWRASVN